MAEFTMAIAGHSFAVRSLFDSTRDYCARYLTGDTPEFCLEVFREELAAMQEVLRQEALAEGMKVRTFSDPFLERTVLQQKAAQQLLRRDILLFHGSGLALDEDGYLFTAARCGTGKSTHTRHWQAVFGSRVRMVNDDKPFLKITPTGAEMFGAPWSGKHGLDTNIHVPLKGLCILSRGPENRICPLSPEQALPMLLHQSQMPQEKSDLPRFYDLVQTLSQTVPLWQMACTNHPQAAEVAAAVITAHSGRCAAQ